MFFTLIFESQFVSGLVVILQFSFPSQWQLITTCMCSEIETNLGVDHLIFEGGVEDLRKISFLQSLYSQKNHATRMAIKEIHAQPPKYALDNE